MAKKRQRSAHKKKQSVPRKNRTSAPLKPRFAVQWSRRTEWVIRIALILFSSALVLGIAEFFAYRYIHASMSRIQYAGDFFQWREKFVTKNPNRTRSNIYFNEAPNEYNIAFLGDSFTWGHFIPDDRNLAVNVTGARLNAHYPFPVQTWNLSHNAYHTELEREELERAYQGNQSWAFFPDMVILAYHPNDAWPEPPYFPTPLENQKWLLNRSYFAQFLNMRTYGLYYKMTGQPTYLDGLRRHYRDDHPGWQRVRTNIEQLQKFCREYDAQFFIAVWTLMEDFQNYPVAFAHEKVAELGEELGIPVYDSLPVFQQSDKHWSDLRVLWNDEHPNEKANRIFADGLLLFIKSNKLLTFRGYPTLRQAEAEMKKQEKKDDRSIWNLVHVLLLQRKIEEAGEYAQTMQNPVPFKGTHDSWQTTFAAVIKDVPPEKRNEVLLNTVRHYQRLPYTLEANYDLAIEVFNTGNIKESYNLLAKALQQAIWRETKFIETVIRFVIRGEYDFIEPVLNTFLSGNPSSQKGQTLAACIDALQAEGKDEEVILNYAEERHREKDYLAAYILAYYVKNRSSQNLRANLLTAYAAVELNDLKQAGEAFTKALGLAPQDAEILEENLTFYENYLTLLRWNRDTATAAQVEDRLAVLKRMQNQKAEN